MRSRGTLNGATRCYAIDNGECAYVFAFYFLSLVRCHCGLNEIFVRSYFLLIVNCAYVIRDG